MRGPRRRRRSPLVRRSVIVLTLAVSTIVGLAAANVVPASKADDDRRPATANDLKPPECAGLNLVNTIDGTNGTNQPDLITGGPTGESIRGRNRDDCILGGGGNDIIRGDAGNDVCIGGPGFDLFIGCEVQYQ